MILRDRRQVPVERHAPVGAMNDLPLRLYVRNLSSGRASSVLHFLLQVIRSKPKEKETKIMNIEIDDINEALLMGEDTSTHPYWEVE